MKSTRKGVTKNVKYYNGLKWNKSLVPEMKKFEKETGKHAVYRNKVTGGFEYWLYWRSTKQKNKQKSRPKPKQKVKRKIKQRQQRQVIVPRTQLIKPMRRGSSKRPIVDTVYLNEQTITYNWTEGQLYVNDKEIGEQDSKYGRDLLLYAKIHSPRISTDEIQNHLIFNYDYARKNNWNTYAESIKLFAKEFGIIVEQ